MGLRELKDRFVRQCSEHLKLSAAVLLVVFGVITSWFLIHWYIQDEEKRNDPLYMLVILWLVISVAISVAYLINYLREYYLELSIGSKKSIPPLGTQGASATSLMGGPLSHHDDAVAKEDTFEINYDLTFRATRDSASTWAAIPRGKSVLPWSTEGDIAKYVNTVLMDIINSLGMNDLSLRVELQFHGMRPDLYILYQDGKPIGAVEVKLPMNRPRGSAMRDPNVFGQVYDYLQHLRNYYGIVEPFVILSTYMEWRVFWLKDSKVVARKREPTYTRPNVETPGDKALHNWPYFQRNLANTVNVGQFGERKVSLDTRQCFCSRIVNRTDPNLLAFIGSALMKMNSVTIHTPEFNVLSRAIVMVQSELWSWVYLSSNGRGFTWEPKAPPLTANKFYLLSPLGSGANGKVWLACTTGKQICAIKFAHHREDSIEESTSQQTVRRSTLADEANAWNVAQPEIGGRVRTLRLDGNEAIVMPYIPQRPQTKNTTIDLTLEERDAVTAAVTAFARQRRRHDDVGWRHIGFYRDKHHRIRSALLDLGLVSTISSREERGAIKSMLTSLGME